MRSPQSRVGPKSSEGRPHKRGPVRTEAEAEFTPGTPRTARIPRVRRAAGAALPESADAVDPAAAAALDSDLQNSEKINICCFKPSSLCRSVTAASGNQDVPTIPPDSFFVVVWSLCHVQLFATPWMAACQASLSFTISWNLLKLMSIELVMPSNHLILCRPLLLLPSIFPSIRVFSSESALHIRWLKYWSFSFSISPSNEYSGLIPFRMDWFVISLLFKGLSRVFSNTSSKASICQHSAFFMAQLSHPYMTTRKTITLTRQTFVDQVMSLLFNSLSRFSRIPS